MSPQHRVRFFLASSVLGALIWNACASSPQKRVFLQNMPRWMIEDQSMYINRGIDSSHVIDGQVARSEGIARERARFRVAIHIANKIKEFYKQSQNAHQKPYDETIFTQITQAIAASLDQEIQLGEYINPNNQEVFMLVRVDGYQPARLERLLFNIKALDVATVRLILAKVQVIFKAALSYDEVEIPKSM
ncbi:hypothetical protein [Helicobacter bizzozeronii]|uniref:hypothetical protein n=1 Tax=Helicobacter bizzozeronii TaxID=56877 RepID=UPI000CEF2433|nr:hypothetical protein [Helicobacter bizzozeronii]